MAQAFAEEKQHFMKRNRKKVDTYRFNGYPHLHTGSIHSVKMVELESFIKKFEAKLADPNDADDKKWTARWLSRFRKELDKKREGRGLKQGEMRDHRRITNSATQKGIMAP